ncbi:hypothetical protein FO519_008643 [Halicephalobus sp. NKZ332]|nr:hypothetical protein FO519_008643 [Halicephalobus sp. NKZ332]
MASVLSSFFSRDPKANFGYDLPSEYFCVFNGVCLGNSFKKAEPNEKATCFWAKSENYKLKNQAMKLKTLRHPNVLAFLDFAEIEGTLYLITEPCKPLSVYFEDSQLTPAQKELVVSWGLYQLLSCLKFLHNEARISHGNIREGIYVTASGDWKFSGFHNTSAFQSPKTDLNDLAAVVWQVFNGFTENLGDSRSIAKIPKRLQTLYKKLESKGQVFASGDLLTESRAVGGFMKNKFVDTLLFLEEFQLKEASEKQSFFMNLKENLDMFPDDIAKYKILPKLIHAYEFGNAGAHILLPMFKLGRLLEEDEYQHRIVPCLVKLFSSPDRTTRVKLLEKIDEFAPHLKSDVINEKIYGNLVTGFLDTNPAVRESTVKAMVPLAEKLNYHNLNTDLMKYLARLQGGDDQPGIRTNTTICLGKIGCYIDPSQRQKILISAFTRALKDPFPPARMSGVLALGATQQYYSLSEVASRILPTLAPLTMDPEKQVRDQGFKALKGFLEKLEKASENPSIIPELEAQVNAGGRSGLLSSEKVPQWAGWAIKAISGKFYKSSNPVSNPEEKQVIQEEKRPTTTSTTASSTMSTTKIDSSSGKSQVVDGWGDMEDEEENESDGNGAESWTTRAKSMEKTIQKKDKVSGWDVDEKQSKASGWDIDEKESKTAGWDVDEKQDDPDDWSTDWEKPKKETKPAATSKGMLKLNKTVKKEEVDVETLFGITPTSTQDSKRSTPSRSTKEASPASSKNSGWDDFEVQESNNSGWDNDDWGDAPSKPKTSNRKAELAARNEQKKQELSAKRATKGIGAMKLGGNKGD